MASDNYKEINCPFCGRLVRSTDKFCLFCGKPLKEGSQRKKKEKKAEKQIKKDKKKAKREIKEGKEEKGENEDNKGDKMGFFGYKPSGDKIKQNEELKPFLVSDNEKIDTQKSESAKKEGEKEKESSEKKKEREKEKEEKEEEIPDHIKEQLETKMELALLDEKKQKLKKKLNQLTNSLDKDKYDWDEEYKKNINIKLEAFKKIKQELLDEENQLREKLGGVFRVDELKEEIALKREQLVELKRSYKRRKIKKQVYKQLKQEYVEEFESAEEELENLQKQLIRWLSKEKAKKNRTQSQINLIEGRYKSKELD